jgi:DNA polymerase III sliding clamp (beta) subunit (PCNA family)
MRHLLPPNLGELARITDPETTRYPLGGVKLELRDDKYVAVATDARSMVVVEGQYVADAPAIAGIRPSEAAEAIIPAKHWKKAFSSLPKPRKKRKGKTLFPDPFVEVSAQSHTTQLATTDLETESIQSVRNLEGRYPKYEAVVTNGTPRAVVALDPKRLIDVLAVAAKFVGPENLCVVLEVYGHSDLVQITAGNGEQKFRGLIAAIYSEDVASIDEQISAEEQKAAAPAAQNRAPKRPAVSRKK